MHPLGLILVFSTAIIVAVRADDEHFVFTHNEVPGGVIHGGGFPVMHGGAVPLMHGGAVPLMHGGAVPLMHGGAVPVMPGVMPVVGLPPQPPSGTIISETRKPTGGISGIVQNTLGLEVSDTGVIPTFFDFWGVKASKKVKSVTSFGGK